MLEGLKAIAADPFARHPNVSPLRGEPHAFRLRQGDWRALDRVDRAAQEVRVYVIETRGLPMSQAAAITPITETSETVTLRRTDYEALLKTLEDAKDIATLRAAEAAVERGESELLPIAVVERLLHGDSPLRVWPPIAA